jgi:hypothetical protein
MIKLNTIICMCFDPHTNNTQTYITKFTSKVLDLKHNRFIQGLSIWEPLNTCPNPSLPYAKE